MRTPLICLPLLLTFACSDDSAGTSGDDPGSTSGEMSTSSSATDPDPTSGSATTDPDDTMTSSGTGSDTTSAVADSSSSGGDVAFNAYSVQLDGDASFVDLGPRDAIFGGAVATTTVSVWVRLDAVPPGDELSGDGIFFIEGEAGFGDGLTVFWSTEKDEPSIAFYPPGVLGGLRGAPADPTGWTHVAVVYEPEVSARLYLDGELATEAVPEAGSVGASGNVIVGRYLDPNFATAGYFDEVAIWNAALSTEEIASVYGDGPQDLSTAFGDYASADALLGWWRMGDDDGGEGETVTDAIGANDGVLVEPAAFSTEAP